VHMKIMVTERDIEDGGRFDPDGCAIARALNRAGFRHLGVMGPSVMVADAWGRVLCVPLPAAARLWILDFDSGKRVGPISFELALGEEAAPDVAKMLASRSSRSPSFKRRFSPGDCDHRPSCCPRHEPELCVAC